MFPFKGKENLGSDGPQSVTMQLEETYQSLSSINGTIILYKRQYHVSSKQHVVHLGRGGPSELFVKHCEPSRLLFPRALIPHSVLLIWFLLEFSPCFIFHLHPAAKVIQSPPSDKHGWTWTLKYIYHTAKEQKNVKLGDKTPRQETNKGRKQWENPKGNPYIFCTSHKWPTMPRESVNLSRTGH